MKNLIGKCKVHFGKATIMLLASFALFVVMASCKHNNKGGSGDQKDQKPLLTSLTIDGKVMAIADEMDAGISTKNKVIVKHEHSPSDAEVEFIPALDAEGKWVLETFGKHSLKIIVKKGEDKKEYTVKIEKESSSPLKSLKIGQDVKRIETVDGVVAGISEEMEFAVPFYATEVDVVVDAKEGYTAAWTKLSQEGAEEEASEIKNGKLNLDVGISPDMLQAAQLTTEYTLTLKKEGGSSATYKVKVIRVVSGITIDAATNKGVASISPVQLNDLLNHTGELELNVYGPELLMTFYTKSLECKSFVVNEDNGADEELWMKKPEGQGLDPTNPIVPIATKVFALEKGQSKMVTIRLENNEVEPKTVDGKNRVLPTDGSAARETFKFKLTRVDATADCRTLGLFVGGDDANENRENLLQQLCSETNFPVFYGGEPCEIKVQYPLTQKMQSVTIDGVAVTPVEDAMLGVCTATKDISGFTTAPKDVTIVMTPQDTTNFHTTTWRLKLSYVQTEAIPVDYSINGLGGIVLEGFVEEVSNGAKPLMKLPSKNFNIRLASESEFTEVKVTCGGTTTTYPSDKIKKLSVPSIYPGVPPTETYICVPSLQLSDTTEKDVKIEVTPKNKGKFTTRVFEFKVQGNGNVEKMNPVLQEIDGETNFSEEFIKKLTDLSDIKVHQIANTGATAKVVLQLSAYDAEFLCDLENVKVDGQKVTLVSKIVGTDLKYEGVATITGITAAEKLINIEFKGKAAVADDVNWQFKIKNGGTLAKIPESITSLYINGQGTDQQPLPNSLKEHLTDESKPVFEVYGKTPKVKVGAKKLMVGEKMEAVVKEVEFKLVGSNPEVKETVAMDDADTEVSAQYQFSLSNVGTEYEIEAKLIPTDAFAAQYSPLVFKFKLKPVDEKDAINCNFVLNKGAKPSGHKEDLKLEYASLLVQITGDLAKKVEIGKEGGSLEAFDEKKFTSFKTGEGNTIYEAGTEVALETTSYQTYVIKVTPKDETKYATTICKYVLKGNTVDAGNAEFVFDYADRPLADPKVTERWAGVVSGYADDPGARKGTVAVTTVSPRAKVYYQIVNVVTLQPMPGKNQVQLTNTGSKGRHVSDVIELYDHQPTKLKVWVESENNTKDDTKGLWYFTFNPVPLWWGYVESKSSKNFTMKAYDEITIEPTKVVGGKIYLMIAPWVPDWGLTVGNEGLPAFQTPFIPVGMLGFTQMKYWSSVDVQDLIAGTVTKKEAQVKLALNGVPCMTYKINIKK